MAQSPTKSPGKSSVRGSNLWAVLTNMENPLPPGAIQKSRSTGIVRPAPPAQNIQRRRSALVPGMPLLPARPLQRRSASFRERLRRPNISEAGEAARAWLRLAGKRADDLLLNQGDADEDSGEEESTSSRHTVRRMIIHTEDSKETNEEPDSEEQDETFYDADSTMLVAESHEPPLKMERPTELRLGTKAGRAKYEVHPSKLLAPPPSPSPQSPQGRVHQWDPNCPLHGLRRRKAALEVLLGTGLSAKLARKRKRARLSGAEREAADAEKAKITSNLCILSTALLFFVTAFQGLQNLQTTVHSVDSLGSISLATLYLGEAASSLFLPPYLLNRLGAKRTLITAVALHGLYLLAHLNPEWSSLLPASFVVGAAASCVWAAKSAYLIETGLRYAHLNIEAPNVVIVRFFGVFFMIVYMGQVFGNLISSATLRATMGREAAGLEDVVDESCGRFFAHSANLTPRARDNLQRPMLRAYRAVCGIYLACIVVSVAVIALFLNGLRRDTEALALKPRWNLEVMKTSVKAMRDPRVFLLIPLTLYNGLEQAFIAGEFTKAYVGCCLGVSRIGLVMTAFGITNAVCSLVFGPLIKLFGRMPLLAFAGVVNLLMLLAMRLWPPNPADTAIFYVFAATWGMADAVWNTQISGLWAVLLGGQMEAALASYRLWASLGLCLGFSLESFLPTSTQLAVMGLECYTTCKWIGKDPFYQDACTCDNKILQGLPATIWEEGEVDKLTLGNLKVTDVDSGLYGGDDLLADHGGDFIFSASKGSLVGDGKFGGTVKAGLDCKDCFKEGSKITALDDHQGSCSCGEHGGSTPHVQVSLRFRLHVKSLAEEVEEVIREGDVYIPGVNVPW